MHRRKIILRSSILVTLLFLTAILLPAEIRAQRENDCLINDSFQNSEKLLDSDSKKTAEINARESERAGNNTTFVNDDESASTDSIWFDKTNSERIISIPEKAKTIKTTSNDTEKSPPLKERFYWKPALIQSGVFLGIQHGSRLFQPKTTREFGGPFFRDWGNSIKNLRGWNDGDSPFTNNFAHPLQGGVTGRIFVNNSDRAKKLEFGESKEYWKSRLGAFAWSAAWSTQFEFGPVSEATIGNVGLRQKNGHSTMAWTDLVMTPVVGTAVLVEEDMIDKYVLKNWLERKNSYRVTTKIKILRSVLTPTTSFSNLLRGKVPWKRDAR
jgi:hypothetical protein